MIRPDGSLGESAIPDNRLIGTVQCHFGGNILKERRGKRGKREEKLGKEEKVLRVNLMQKGPK
jgi:hypothetical protein